MCKKAPLTESLIHVGRKDCLEFDFKGSPYSISLAPSTYSFELWGAAGGFSTHDKIVEGGKGGYTRGNIQIHSYQTLFLYVGGQGGNSTKFTLGSGGYNGGANGGSYDPKHDCPSAGSGGATDIRIALLKGNLAESLSSRIMVAGGGGSSGCWIYARKGGDGGGIKGVDGLSSIKSPYSTTTYAGGSGGSQASGFQLGQGEVGESGGSNGGEAGGSGGGGYFGGYGGKTGLNGCSGGSGGGGSSFISGHPDCIAVDEYGHSIGSSVHSSGLFFTCPSTVLGQNPGNGRAIIKWISSPPMISKCRCIYYFHSSYNFIALLLIGPSK